VGAFEPASGTALPTTAWTIGLEIFGVWRLYVVLPSRQPSDVVLAVGLGASKAKLSAPAAALGGPLVWLGRRDLWRREADVS
jgi:hypothetical protein